MKEKPIIKKSKHEILLRLDDETNEMLDTYSKMIKTNKTQLIRNSITNFMFVNLDNSNYPNPKSIFSQSMVHFLLDKCKDDELKELAQISYDLSQIEINDSTIMQDIMEQRDAINLTKNLVKYIFSPRGHSWFDECNYIARGSNISIYGSHNMGPKFHIFVKYLLQLYFHDIGYAIIRDRQNMEDLISQSSDYKMTCVKRKFYKFSVTLGPMKD